MWAAYKKGTWDENEQIPKDLDVKGFSTLVEVLSHAGIMMVIKAPNEYPVVGLISLREDRFCIEPHIDWFPWATERNKIEGVVRAALFLREIKPVLIWSMEKTNKFFEHVCKYGVLRRVGSFDGKDCRYGIFQSKGE